MGDGDKRPWFWVVGALAVTVLASSACTAAGLDHQEHTITYSVTGTGTDVMIVYGVQKGSRRSSNAEDNAALTVPWSKRGSVTAEDNALTLPWSKTVIASGPLTGFGVTATTGINAGSVTCTISEDGGRLSQNTAHGWPQLATCSLPGGATGRRSVAAPS